MARIPEVAQAAGVGVGRIRQAGATDPTAAPVDFSPVLFTASQSLQEFADDLHDDAIRRDSLMSVRAEAEFAREVDAGTAELDPLTSGFEAEVERIVSEAAERALTGADFETSEVEDDLRMRLTIQGEGAVTTAQVIRRTSLWDEAEETFMEVQSATLAKIIEDPGATGTYMREFSQQFSRLEPALDPNRLLALRRDFEVAATRAQIEGIALSGDIAAAERQAEAASDQMTQDEFHNVKRRIREIENQNRQDFLRDTVTSVADLEIGIVGTIETGGDLDVAEAQVEDFQENGMFEGRQEARVRLIKMISNARRARITGQRDTTEALERFNSGLGLDTKRQAELAWDAMAATISPDTSPQDVLEFASQFAVTSGWVPPAITQQFTNAERTENPELLAAAALQFDTIRQRARDAQGLSEAGDRTLLTSAMQEFLGTTYEQAASMVQQNLPTSEQLTQRRAQFQEEIAEDFDPVDDLVDEFEVFSDDDIVSDEAVVEYEKRVRSFYDMHGNLDFARAAASRAVGLMFGETSVGGEPRTQRLAPEGFFPGAVNNRLDPEAKQLIIEQDIERFLATNNTIPSVVLGAEEAVRPLSQRQQFLREEMGLPPMPAFVDASGFPPYSLVTDIQTENDLANERPPSYELRVRGQFGVLVPVGRYVMPTMEQLNEDPTFMRLRDEALDAAITERENEGSDMMVSP